MPDAVKLQSGVVSPGDEIVSLSRAFITAGAPSVLATLWSVNSESAMELMADLYGRLSKGVGKGAALRCAQLELMENGYANPYEWAGFVLAGDMGSGTLQCVEPAPGK